MRRVVLIACLLLAGCEDQMKSDNDYNRQYFQYYVECLDRALNLPNNKKVPYNGYLDSGCREYARVVAGEGK